MTEYCPVLRPTFEEFIHPKEYIKSIESIVFKHGICKIIPPPSWNPRHSIQCLCGPGNFMNACKHKAKCGIGNTRHNANRFGIHSNNPDNYMKSDTHVTPECLCSMNNIFGDDVNDSLFNTNINHMNLCPHSKEIHYGNDKCIEKSEANQNDKTDSYHELLSKLNIEKCHRNQYDSDILGKTIKQLSMDDINCLVHVYFPYDHIWYEAKIIDINLLRNACDIQLIGDEIKDEIITIYPMEIT
eukprot:43147_1